MNSGPASVTELLCDVKQMVFPRWSLIGSFILVPNGRDLRCDLLEGFGLLAASEFRRCCIILSILKNQILVVSNRGPKINQFYVLCVMITINTIEELLKK